MIYSPLSQLQLAPFYFPKRHPTKCGRSGMMLRALPLDFSRSSHRPLCSTMPCLGSIFWQRHVLVSAMKKLREDSNQRCTILHLGSLFWCVSDMSLCYIRRHISNFLTNVFHLYRRRLPVSFWKLMGSDRAESRAGSNRVGLTRTENVKIAVRRPLTSSLDVP